MAPADERVPYPGRLIKAGSTGDPVNTVQRRLVERGCGPLEETGDFDAATTRAVKLFQARFPDVDGRPLKVDGVVGPITWAALFGREIARGPDTAVAPLLRAALRVANGEIGVMEVPPGSNRGPKVDEYLRAVRLEPTAGSFPWCAAFLYWCFDRAAEGLARPNPLVRTAGVLDHWRKAQTLGVQRVLTADAAADPERVQPGQIFILATGGVTGHTGLVEEVANGRLTTIEGNTNDGGTREGIGVFRRRERKILEINRGFLDYAGR